MASAIVLSGLALLYITGAWLIATGSQPSERFWAKMTIVAVITINGMVMHRQIFPLMKRCVVERLAITSDAVLACAPLAISCGAISAVSWNVALILGAWRSLQVGYFGILAGYFFCVTVAVIGGNVMLQLALRKPHLVAKLHGFVMARSADSAPTPELAFIRENKRKVSREALQLARNN